MGGVARNMLSKLRNTGIINFTTQLHIVGSFYEIYITMHGSMNIKLISNRYLLSSIGIHETRYYLWLFTSLFLLWSSEYSSSKAPSHFHLYTRACVRAHTHKYNTLPSNSNKQCTQLGQTQK
jgi:hypothetical protein